LEVKSFFIVAGSELVLNINNQHLQLMDLTNVLNRYESSYDQHESIGKAVLKQGEFEVKQLLFLDSQGHTKLVVVKESLNEAVPHQVELFDMLRPLEPPLVANLAAKGYGKIVVQLENMGQDAFYKQK
jgi:hypothetical protein